MTAAVVVLCVLAAVAYVAAPLWRGPRKNAAEATGPAAEIEARKTAALTGIIDLEDERATGKMSVEDFDELRASYEREAMAALAELDALSSPEPPVTGDDDALEAEIAAMRARLTCRQCGSLKARPGRCDACGSEA